MAGEDIGKAEIEITADTSHFPQDVKRGVEASLHETDPVMKKTGEDWGDELSKGLTQRMKFKFPEVIGEVKRALDKEHITEHIKVDTDVDHDSVRKTVKKLAADLENEVSNSGIFSFFGQGILDAVGSAFNISGKSPALFVLIPAFGALGALIAAAVEAVYGLGAALLTIPNLLSAILAEAGVLYLIFQNISGVIAKAFAAQNATELAAAFKGVDPYIQNFILELIYIRDAFKAISDYLSVAFFKNLGNTLLDIFDINRYTLFHGLLTLAGDLGTYFADVGKAFESPEFAKFLFDLFQEIDKFLKTNGPALQKFLTQVFGFLDSLMGATGDVGGLFNEWLKSFGDFLAETGKSKEFQDFLKEMPGVLRESGKLILALFDTILAILSSTNKAGGKDFLTNLTELIMILNAFLTSDVGIKGLNALLVLLLILTAAFIDIVIAITSVFAAVEYLGDFLIGLGNKVVDFFKGLWKSITESFSRGKITGFLKDVVDYITAAFDGLPSKLYNIGVNLVKSFIAGMLQMKNPASSIAGQVVGAVAGAFPSSPAKFGPFSGKGAPFNRGTSTMDDFTKGLISATDQSVTNANSAMSNVNFGSGAVIANFYGAQPTPEQAQTLGNSLGSGIGDQLMARNARLAVRTM